MNPPSGGSLEKRADLEEYICRRKILKDMGTAVNVKAAGGCSQEWAGEKLDMASQPTHSCAD